MKKATPAPLNHLLGLYAQTDDPWDFRTSDYEASRFEAIERALPRPRYTSALELGCGNGELARLIAQRCDSYTGLDAVPAALAAARKAVPEGRFVEGFLPCDLPGTGYDLVMLSEVLYFLSAASIRKMADRIDATCPGADVVTVTWCGPTGHALDGEAAFVTYANQTLRTWRSIRADGQCRIAVFDPLQHNAP